MKKLILIALCLSFFGLESTAQTLSAGDIAIVQYNADGGEILKFLALEDIPAGEQLNFTDNGWFASGSFRTGEGGSTWTSPVGGIACGTVVTHPFGGGLSGSGDQVLVYQGSSASPTFITALNAEGTPGVWQADATSSNTSALPTGLTNGTDAVALDEIDNAKYNGVVLSGTKAAIRAAIHDKSNWTGDNSVNQDFTDSFTITDCGGVPGATTVSFRMIFFGLLTQELQQVIGSI